MSKENKPAIDAPMLLLFRQELHTHCSTIQEQLSNLYSGSIDSVQYDQLIKACRSSNGTAKLVQLPFLAELTYLYEELFSACQRKEIVISGKIKNLLDSSIDLLLQLSEIDINALNAWLDTKIEIIHGISVELADALNRKSPEKEKEKEKEKPKAKKTGTRKKKKKISTKKKKSTVTTTTVTAKAAPAPLHVGIDPMMLELFQIEVDTNTGTMSEDLIALEKSPDNPEKLESLMRAAHSIKGAARMIELDHIVGIAHTMEDCFVAAQKGDLQLRNNEIDIFLQSTDMICTITELSSNSDKEWSADHETLYRDLCSALTAINEGKDIPEHLLGATHNIVNESELVNIIEQPQEATEYVAGDDRILRITASRINKLMGLSGEILVSSGWIKGYAESLVTIKRRQTELINTIEHLRAIVEQTTLSDHTEVLLNSTQDKANECRQLLSNRLNELEEFDRRSVNLAARLNHEVLASRMRPFEDGVKGFQRMVRDVARTLGKQIELNITGLATQVDRDILEKIEAPLNHIIRNAVDHGIELPTHRAKNGKPPFGTIKLEAHHSSGMLSVVVQDDGQGVDLDKLRKSIIDKRMVNPTMAGEMTESELLDFLFLPGFTTKQEVTEISGRGVGLDVVHTAVQEMRGTIRSTTKPGHGLRIQLQLPLTLSVVRCLLVNVDQEPYAFPLARISCILSTKRSSIQVMEDRQFISYNNDLIGLVDAYQILGGTSQVDKDENILVIVIGDRSANYGLVVTESLGEHSLAVQPIDPRLGKVRDISAAAILHDGTPTLIIDIDDMIRSIENLVSGKRLNKVQDLNEIEVEKEGKRILVVDDSLTVREVERKLLESHGYSVDVAVDGMDGWNSVRLDEYDLVISDVDMPRMNGIEFVTMIKNDVNLRSIPVMIVSYKDRQEDRSRGLEAGADYYLTKGSFHDDSLIDAVLDLIGEAKS